MLKHTTGRPTIDCKLEDIRSHFAAFIGTKIIRYETAEMLCDDGTWDDRFDLPIRLYSAN